MTINSNQPYYNNPYYNNIGRKFCFFKLGHFNILFYC